MAIEFNLTTGITTTVEDIVMPRDFNQEMTYVRQERNSLLTQSDWTQIADADLTDAKKTEWATYRQQLRDLPASLTTTDDIDNVVWPTKPQ